MTVTSLKKLFASMLQTCPIVTIVAWLIIVNNICIAYTGLKHIQNPQVLGGYHWRLLRWLLFRGNDWISGHFYAFVFTILSHLVLISTFYSCPELELMKWRPKIARYFNMGNVSISFCIWYFNFICKSMFL